MQSNTKSPQAESAVIRVLIADDHPVVRRGIRSELAQHSDIDVLGEAVNGYDALRQLQALQPDVLLLDIGMPGPRTIDVLQQALTLPKRPAVLVLTAYKDPEHIMGMLRAGAKGYILKDDYPENIVVAIRAVAHGESWLSAAVLANVINHSVSETEAPAEPLLSERESEVLEQLVQGKGNQEIGDLLYISERTVRFHLRNIYDKLGVSRRAEAIAWGMREQYRRQDMRWQAAAAD